MKTKQALFFQFSYFCFYFLFLPKPKSKYSKSHIIKMTWDEAIRKRPGMYIGRINQKGFSDMLKRILTSTLASTHASFVSLELIGHSSAVLRFEQIENILQDNWSQWNPNPTNPFILEPQTLNALSDVFKIKFWDKEGKEIAEQLFEKGKLIKGNTEQQTINCASVEIEFTLDKEIWGEDFSWNATFISYQIRTFAYFHKKVKIEMKYTLDSEVCRVIYHFKNGLKDRLDIEKLKGLGDSYFETTIDKKINDIHLEAAFAFRDYSVDEPFLKSYVNDHYTHV